MKNKIKKYEDSLDESSCNILRKKVKLRNRIFLFLSLMKGLTFFLFVCIFSFSSSALNESNISFVYDLLDKKEFYQTGEFIGEENIKLHYAQFGKTRGKKGALVFVSGRAENLFKYTELFYDLHLKGWSPIYTYDHRGQGLSDRLLTYLNIGHIEDFSYYRKDLKTFLDIVKKNPQVDKNNLFLISHSMGGLITVDYLQTYGNLEFKALVLSSPMFQIKIRTKSFFAYLSSLYCSFSGCLKQEIKKENKRSVLTYSKAREAFFRYLQKERFPKSKLGPPSLSWLIKSSKTGRKSMLRKEIQKIQIPLLILQAEQDVVVSNDHHKKFCEAIPQNCELKIFSGKHDLFIEKDKIRDQVIADVMRFFSQQK